MPSPIGGCEVTRVRFGKYRVKGNVGQNFLRIWQLRPSALEASKPAAARRALRESKFCSMYHHPCKSHRRRGTRIDRLLPASCNCPLPTYPTAHPVACGPGFSVLLLPAAWSSARLNLALGGCENHRRGRAPHVDGPRGVMQPGGPHPLQRGNAGGELLGAAEEGSALLLEGRQLTRLRAARNLNLRGKNVLRYGQRPASPDLQRCGLPGGASGLTQRAGPVYAHLSSSARGLGGMGLSACALGIRLGVASLRLPTGTAGTNTWQRWPATIAGLPSVRACVCACVYESSRGIVIQTHLLRPYTEQPSLHSFGCVVCSCVQSNRLRETDLQTHGRCRVGRSAVDLRRTFRALLQGHRQSCRAGDGLW